LSSLNSLQTVDLAFNKLQTVPQRWFEKWVSVETLRLNNNQLTELPASLGAPPPLDLEARTHARRESRCC
jgi:Leucine-rich repeat (LRR) protein